MRYDAFISYSQTADGRLAPAIQQGLQRLARPWYRRRALHVFRDDTGLSATPDLWASIQAALDESRQFIVLASPEAAHSRWVAREIDHWRATRPGDAILTVVTEGDWAWDDGTHDFDWERSPAIPRALRGAFADEPKLTDLRWARDELDLDLRNARFRRSLAVLAAPLHGVSPDDLEGEDIRQHRRFRRIATATMAVLAVLVLLTSVATVLALRSRDQARAQARTNLARSLAQTAKGASTESPRLAALLALESYRLRPGRDEQAAVLGALASTRSVAAVLRGTSGAVSHVQFVDSRRLFSSGVDTTLRLWDVAKPGAPTQTFRQEMTTFAVLPTGIVSGRSDGKVEFELGGHDLVRPAHRLKVEALVVTPDHKLAATSSNDGTIMFWSLPDGTRRGEPISASGATTSLAFDPTGRVLYSVGTAGELRRWNVSTHAEIGAATAVTQSALDAVAVNPASGGVATGGGDRSVHFLAPDGQTVRHPSLTSGGIVLSLAFSADGRRLAIGEGFGTVEVWSALGRVPLNPALLGHEGPAVSVAFSPDGTLLASAGDDGTARIWRVGAAGLAAVTSRATDIVWSVALNRDGTRGAAAANDGAVRIWPTRPARAASVTVRPAKAGTHGFAVAFGANGSTLFDGVTVATSASASAYVAEAWDVSARPHLRWRRTLETGRSGGAVRIAVPDSGAFVAVSAFGTAVRLLDPRSGELRRRIATGGDVDAIAISPDGSQLAASYAKGRIRLWNVADGRAEQTLTGPSGRAFALAFSAAGDELAAADQGGRVSLWVRAGGAFARRPLLALHRGAMEGVAFSPDGATLAATGADGDLVLWDVASGALFAELASGGGESPSVAWRAGALLTGQDDGLVAAWDPSVNAVDLTSVTAALCPYAKPALSRAEWKNFLPGRAYRPLCR